jgi:hypothetical protein
VQLLHADLPGSVFMADHRMIAEHGFGHGIDAMAGAGLQARRIDMHATGPTTLAQHGGRHRAAADITDADNQDTAEHISAGLGQ